MHKFEVCTRARVFSGPQCHERALAIGSSTQSVKGAVEAILDHELPFRLVHVILTADLEKSAHSAGSGGFAGSTTIRLGSLPFSSAPDSIHIDDIGPEVVTVKGWNER